MALVRTGTPRRDRVMPRNAGSFTVGSALVLALSLVASPGLARRQAVAPGDAPSATQPMAPAVPGSGPGAGAATPAAPQHLTHAQLLRLRQMHASPAGLGSPARQNRELDQIGKNLLAGTPKAPAGSTDQTGGGTVP